MTINSREIYNEVKERDSIDRGEAIELLRELHEARDTEVAHLAADEIMMKLVDEEVRAAYDAVGKWYA